MDNMNNKMPRGFKVIIVLFALLAIGGVVNLIEIVKLSSEAGTPGTLEIIWITFTTLAIPIFVISAISARRWGKLTLTALSIMPLVYILSLFRLLTVSVMDGVAKYPGLISANPQFRNLTPDQLEATLQMGQNLGIVMAVVMLLVALLILLYTYRHRGYFVSSLSQ